MLYHASSQQCAKLAGLAGLAEEISIRLNRGALMLMHRKINEIVLIESREFSVMRICTVALL